MSKKKICFKLFSWMLLCCCRKWPNKILFWQISLIELERCVHDAEGWTIPCTDWPLIEFECSLHDAEGMHETISPYIAFIDNDRTIPCTDWPLIELERSLHDAEGMHKLVGKAVCVRLMGADHILSLYTLRHCKLKQYNTKNWTCYTA